MRIAFYAPLNAPDRGRPSGDRTIGRMIIRALSEAGHEVEIVSRFKSFDGGGDGARQERLERIGARLADRLVYQQRHAGAGRHPRQALAHVDPGLRRDDGPGCDLWLTYHLYHKAPDLLGPMVSKALGIPYVVAEASFAGKQAKGSWARGHALVAEALRQAHLVIGLNRSDREGVLPLLASPNRCKSLPPFIDCRPFADARLDRERHRQALGLPLDQPLLLAVGMMREGAKLASYRLLAEALTLMEDKFWRLVIVGDGEAEPQVRAAFVGFGDRIHFLGRRSTEELPAIYAACDIFLWPAIKEAMGMVFIEAQAAGLPVVGAHNLGVPDVIDDGVTGFLPAYGDAAAFAEAAARLVDNSNLRQRMGLAAAGYALACHDLPTAGRAFARAVEEAVRR